jgi:PAS domain S-box-containing protein
MRQMEEGLLIRILDSLADSFVLVLDQNSTIVYANRPFLQHFGLAWAEVRGRSCTDLVCPFAAQRRCAQVPAGPVPQSGLLFSRTAGSQQFFYETSSYQIRDGEALPFTLCVFRDVTEKLRMESQIRQLHELERTLVQTSMDGIILNDMEGNILIFNEGASRILGYQAGEVINKINVAELYPPGGARDIKIRLLHPDHGEAGLLENQETVVRHKDGSLVPIWLSARLLKEDGRDLGIVGYFRDLRERKRWEAELLQNERLATLGKMVAHITHEIKNPLLVIGGFARQILRQSELPPAVRQKLTLISQEVQRLEEYLVSLGTFTRVGAASKTASDLVSLVKEVGEGLSAAMQEQGVTFRVEVPQDLPRIPLDPGQIRQVLLNLFKNSLEAMPQGGGLTVQVQPESQYVILKVADTGQGIAPEHLPSLFTPFFSTKEKGTGLGLVICRQLIELHGGAISLTGRPGQGASVTIHLPVSPP